MDLAQLRYFCDVAHTQHMTKSAQRLNIVQPALSQSIHKLEDELGVQLFERTGRNIRITSEGRLFAERASQALSALDAASKEIRVLSEGRKALVRVGISAATSVVVDALAAFASEHPEATFEITRSLEEGCADVRIAMVPSELLGDSMRRRGCEVAAGEEVRFSEQIGVAVPLESSFAETISLRELVDQRFISLAGSRSFREACDRACASQGFVARVGFDSDDPAIVKKIISLGLGVGFWPRISWGSLVGSGARWCTLEEKGFARTLSVKRCLPERDAPMADAFFEFLVGYMDELWRAEGMVDRPILK